MLPVYLCLQCYKETAAEVSGEREGRERKKQELRDGRRREGKRNRKGEERRGHARLVIFMLCNQARTGFPHPAAGNVPI